MFKLFSKSYGDKGFTLIEILIVVAIIGFLSSIVLVGLSSFRSKGRDARRMADLSHIQSALELYFTKNGTYPTTSTWAVLTTALVGAGIGVNSLPNDPTTNWNYGYCYDSAANRYLLAAYLEDTSNPALKQYTSASAFPGCSADLSGTPSNPLCSTSGSITNKYCVTL